MGAGGVVLTAYDTRVSTLNFALTSQSTQAHTPKGLGFDICNSVLFAKDT